MQRARLLHDGAALLPQDGAGALVERTTRAPTAGSQEPAGGEHPEDVPGVPTLLRVRWEPPDLWG